MTEPPQDASSKSTTSSEPPTRVRSVVAVKDSSPSNVVKVEAWKHRLKIKSNGDYDSTPANVALIFAKDAGWRDNLAYDAFADEMMTTRLPPWPEHQQPRDFKPGVLTDSDMHRAVTWLSAEYGIKSSIAEVGGLMMTVAEKNAVHPVRDWMTGLKWDRRNRLDTWLTKYAGAVDSRYTREVGKNFFIGMIARVFRPGCQLDSMPIFEGPQGCGKTSMVRVVGGDWFLSTTIDITNKDAYEVLKRKLLVEMGELDALTRSEVSHVKQYITQSTDTYRRPFARRATDNPRQCVFAGTVNPEDGTGYLKDNTGARRFWPIRVAVLRAIALDKLARDRAQLFAEARVRFERGEAWHFTDREVIEEHAEMTEDRRQADPYEEIVGRWLFANRSRVKDKVEGITTIEILTACFEADLGKITKTDEMRVASALRMCGWATNGKRERRSGHRCAVYRPVLTAAERAEFLRSKSSKTSETKRSS